MLPTTPAEQALLTGANIEVSGGLELLDDANNMVVDISDDLIDGEVEYDNFATVHGSCRLQITRKLNWGRDRVRPYVTVTDGVTTARFNQGVYILATPSEQRGEDPQTWDVTGYSVLHLLQDGPGDTYVVPAATTYLQAVRDVLAAAGLSAPLMADGTLQSKTLMADRVWALVDGGASWLGIIDDLLDEINYDNLYADRDGNLRSGPYRDPSVRPVEWTLDTADESTNIVHQDRRVTEDVANAVNHWRFVRTNMPYQPVEGDGIYTVENVADGPASQDALGRVIRKVVHVDAADQATLIAQGDRIVVEDQQVTRTVSLQIDTLPIQGHMDVFLLTDEGVTEKLVASSWTVSLTGEPAQLTLGGTRKPVPERVEQQATATVSQAAPIRVLLDGATQDCPASWYAGATFTLGDRVEVLIRTPRTPLALGKPE